jgi:hypothetical protein
MLHYKNQFGFKIKCTKTVWRRQIKQTAHVCRLCVVHSYAPATRSCSSHLRSGVELAHKVLSYLSYFESAGSKVETDTSHVPITPTSCFKQGS